MFEWFIGGKSGTGAAGLERMRAEFGQMLDAGRHVFDTAANAFLGGTDLEVIREDLFTTDKRINSAEQKIRRELVVHATVHGAGEFPACLVLMSIVKDAERMGDYAKNIFDLAEFVAKPPEGEHGKRLVELKDAISKLMATCREIFDTDQTDKATELIREAQRIEDICDTQVRELLKAGERVEQSAACALAYRYFKRVASHTCNVASSVVQPVDKLDFPKKETK
jgi:phosphate transport system protein